MHTLQMHLSVCREEEEFETLKEQPLLITRKWCSEDELTPTISVSFLKREIEMLLLVVLPLPLGTFTQVLKKEDFKMGNTYCFDFQYLLIMLCLMNQRSVQWTWKFFCAAVHSLQSHC